MVSSLSGIIPDGFIYLAASPETCMRRMTSRGRGEEGGVSLDYLGSLHSKHEEWLHNEPFGVKTLSFCQLPVDTG